MLRWAFCALLLASCLERKRPAPASSEPAEPATATQEAAPEVPPIRTTESAGPFDADASITIRLPSEPRHLIPLLAGDTIAVQVTLGDVYETLLQMPSPGDAPKLHLATSISQSEDRLEWQIELRDGVRFHDGSRFGTEDVIESIRLAKGAIGPLRGEFDDVQSVRAIGPRQVAVRFAEVRAGRRESFTRLPMVSSKDFLGTEPSKIQLARVATSPNGTGPFAVVDSGQGRIVLERAIGYWGRPAAAKRIVYRVVEDRTRALAEIRAGQIDVLLGLPVNEALTVARADAGLSLVRRSLPAYTAAVFNTQRARLHAGARGALSRSIDRASIVRELFRNFGDIAIGPFVRHGERELPTPGDSVFSLDGALRDLRTGFPDKAPASLELLVPNGSRSMERLADIWSADVRSALAIDVVRLDFAELLARVRSGAFDIALLSFTTSADTDLYNLFHSSEAGRGNLSQLRDTGVDAILEKLRLARDPGHVVSLSHALGRQLQRLAPLAFLTTDVRLGIVRSEIFGVGDSAPAQGARFYGRLAHASTAL